MHRSISHLHWVMLQCTYLLYTIFIPYMESHNWVNAKIPTSFVFPNGVWLMLDICIPCRLCGSKSKVKYPETNTSNLSTCTLLFNTVGAKLISHKNKLDSITIRK